MEPSPRPRAHDSDRPLMNDAGTEPANMIGHSHPKCPGCAEMMDEMESLGDDISHAREEKRLAEALSEEITEKYNRLRRTLSALVMQ
jgi:hypothetical protein